MPPQVGGVRNPVLDEVKLMSGYFLFIGLILASVYVSRIPNTMITKLKSPLFQMYGLIAVILITSFYGWIHGIMAALAFALLVSRAMRESNEGMTDYIPKRADIMVIEEPDSVVIPENHRWFVEKVMGETPFLIREKEVRTSAVQDLSERNMGSSTVTR